MKNQRINLLQIAGVLTVFAALIHIGCIVFGGDWYRFLGAGEQMAQMAESGHSYPTTVTSIISAVLLLWATYAFSGAGLIIKLPLVRLGLALISVVLLARALGFYFIMPAFPDNSLTFWLISSGICLLLGLTYALGLKQRWHLISGKA
ncbi:hypothetical protein EKG38_20000 [Shewanella canadensis]|uniref:DUF3995 domain-containing protein n=1 Tax=Shewanella canadensis TaxID=271096 RepID=A0A3S0K7C7_9GAMM|nr:hypothetical protein [Shewanella canadensis]RTR37219.1 hypothetical protein EKG38_20000 [Shewanella canadensis]